MNAQDTKFNYRVILAVLAAVIIGLLIAFYYSYAQSQNRITYLEDERKLLNKDLIFMKAEVDKLKGYNQLVEIDKDEAMYQVQELLDSVGRLNFKVDKLEESKRSLRSLQVRFDSLKYKNNFLLYNNDLINQKYESTLAQIKQLKQETSVLKEVREEVKLENEELAKELKIKSYLSIPSSSVEGNGFRLRSGRPIQTNKASTIEKLRGCVTILGNPNERGETKIIYFQFLDPDMKVIEDSNQSVSVAGNTYSKRVELVYLGKDIGVCDFITVPEGSLAEGIYTLNVFEDERLLASTEFQFK
ncbi:hypothetical protein HCU67_05900 [Muricauda sp. DJ-13]|uniref:Chromosome partitioning protein ParA n=2 Tax=Croceivirga thetidis TaxID=2721623 RepID=A0ABX1GRB5_9FLAO|nr:hypothetical protein [Croceivirga thetidis]